MRIAVIVCAALALAPPAFADALGAYVSKKDSFLATKQITEAATDAARKSAWQASLDRRVGKLPAPVVSVFNTHTQEYVVVERDPAVSVRKDLVDKFFRCHFTNSPTDMDPKLFHTLVEAARHFESDRVNIVSGFRSPKYNLILRKKGREVARSSQHTMGKAVDFRLPGVPTSKLRAWALKLKLGGVGFYPKSKFVHIDTANVRTWTAD